MDLSIIIVNYCTYDLTKQTIKSVIDREHPFKYEIYLVDNASPDGSFQKSTAGFRKSTSQMDNQI
jgi:GT2 family glycosyltransferase